MENVTIKAKGNTVSLKEGSVKLKCDRCTCDIPDPSRVDGDDLHLEGEDTLGFGGPGIWLVRPRASEGCSALLN